MTLKLLSSILAAFVVAGSFAPAVFADDDQTAKKPFKLKLQKDDKLENQGLSRGKDLKQKKKDTPFASGEDILEANPDNFKAAPVMKAPKPLKATVEDSGGGDLQGQNPMGTPIQGDGMDDTPAPPVQAMPAQPQWDPNDPDSSPDMQLLWDIWHKRVAATIFDRFNFFAKAAFKNSPPLLCQVGYVVTRDGQIKDVNVRKPSSNGMFNVMVCQAVKSLNGDMTVLQFPQGSRRMFVPKVGDFMKNYGTPDGFRHQTGDQEFIKGH
jgi:hypothetical protein